MNSDNLITLEYQGKTITLIPTAHVSNDSAEFVRETIDRLQPDCICIELDQDRFNTLTDPEKYRNTDITKIIREKKVGFMLVNIILSNYQKKLAKQLGSKTGREMMVGIEKSKELNVPLVLADRRIQTTFKRVWANQTLADKFRMLTSIIASLLEDEDISEEELHNLMQKDMLEGALSEVSKAFPKITDVLVVERDRYLTEKIRTAPGNNIVAIIGAAHSIGIQKYINEEFSIEGYDEVPPKTPLQKLAGWIIPAAIVIAIALSFHSNPDMGWQQIKRWVLFNGSLSALGTLAAGGHIISALVAFIAAPVTSLNPLMAAGWFAGLCEARLRKPTVRDFDSLSSDLNDWKGLWKNKVSRILMIVIFANLGSTLGTFISSLDIFSNLFNH